MIVGAMVGFPAVVISNRDTIWRANLTLLSGGAAAALPAGLQLASGVAAERTVQTGSSTLVVAIPQNQGRIGRTNDTEPFALVIEEARTNRWPAARDVEAVGGAGIAAGSGATYSASGLVGPDGTGTPKRVQVSSAGYSRYFSLGTVSSKYCSTLWERTLSGTTLNQTTLTASSPYTFQVRTTTTAWAKQTIRGWIAEAARNFVVLDGRDWASLGGAPAGARDAVVDFLQVEDGQFPTEVIPTTSARTAEFLSRSTAGSTGQISIAMRIRPKGSRAEYTGTPCFFTFGSGSDQAFFIPATGRVTTVCNGNSYTTVEGMNWSAGDVVDIWIRMGGTGKTQIQYRVNDGVPVILGQSAASQGPHGGSGTFYLLNNHGFNNVLSCWVESIEMWKVGRQPAWLAPDPFPEFQNVLWWLRERDLPFGLVAQWESYVGGLSLLGALVAEQPQYSGDGLEFDGTDDVLTQLSSDVATPVGTTKFTLAFWIYFDVLPGVEVILETSFYPSGILVQTSGSSLNFYVGTLNCQLAGLVAGEWQFIALACDLSRPTNAKARSYRGTPTVVEEALAYDNILSTSIPAASGDMLIGGRSAAFPAFRLGDVVLIRDAELVAAQLQQVADETNY